MTAPAKIFKPTTRVRLLPDQISDLRAEVADLRKRVAELEKQPAQLLQRLRKPRTAANGSA
jgi:ubiquinone biosynthesis protein UbiJ